MDMNKTNLECLIDKFSDALSVESFRTEAIQLIENGNVESLQQAFGAHGIELTSDEVSTVIEEYKKNSASDEMSEEMMDLVSGGGWFQAKAFLSGLVFGTAVTGNPITGVLVGSAMVLASTKMK